MKEKKQAFIADDFFRLFVRREWKVVLGRNYSSMWLIVAMLTATFLAIAFSNASMRYLSDKMNDPFIKWVDIKNTFGEGDFVGLESALADPENAQTYGYNNYQSDYYFSYMFFGADEFMLQFFQCRFFESIKTDLVEKILEPGNVIDKCRVADLSSVSDETIGVIITKNVLDKLGYSTAPAYLDLCRFSRGADTLGFKLYDNTYARVPVPVLGVVKRLPSNVDVISTKYFFEQENNDSTYPFNLSYDRSYAQSLRYFVPETVDAEKFSEFLTAQASAAGIETTIDDYTFYKPEIVPYMPGHFISLIGAGEGTIDPFTASSINDFVLAEWKDSGVSRVFDYNFYPTELTEKSYLSVYFDKLDRIRDFESFVDQYNVKLDMSQIKSKENFNAVSIMAAVLSWAIIIFAVVCIILFLVDLLKSHFQKVKRNIGTFKAFGVSNSRLMGIYGLIVGATIVMAVFISVALTLLVQGSFRVCGLMREGIYNYLSLGTVQTAISIFVILGASLATVFIVMKKLLKNTPGDLIYERQ